MPSPSAPKAKHMKKNRTKTRTIKVDYLARVEGEGALFIKIKGGRVLDVKLKIFEPPRFFEAFLRGRDYREVPDITARICGICPGAYQMSAVHAIENALGARVDGQLRELRRLLYCGEWIESHALHIYLLHAPDFLGYADAIEMAKDHPDIVQRGLELKKAGNEIVALLGGREIHPINVCVGGFYKLPAKRALLSLREGLKRARDLALETVKWTAGFPFPDFEQDYEFVSLRHGGEYPLTEGRLLSTHGLDIEQREYEAHFVEEHVPHSNALHSVIKGRGNYLVGPAARYNLNSDRLSPIAKQAAQSIGFPSYCRNPFQSIVVRSVEVVYACDEALRIIDQYEMPQQPAITVVPKRATGQSCTEAPRGILYHRYAINEDGSIGDAKIVPPTSQNQKTIENDLWQVAKNYQNLAQEELQRTCEQTIRNYDPCISCATHFLDIHMDREQP